MKLNNKSLIVKIWCFLTLFSILIITFLWFFQVIFIDTYYEWYKTNEINIMAKLVKNSYNKSSFEKVLNEIYYKRGVCIEINSSDGYSGFSASQYETTFNTLKRTAFVKVPELTDKVNKLLAEARNQYVESENRAAAAASGE